MDLPTLRTTETPRSSINEDIAEWEEVCAECGETYTRRMYIIERPRRMLINERTLCACEDDGITIEDELRQEAGRRLGYILGKRNMLRMESTRHMTLSNYRAETESQKKALIAVNNWTPKKGSVTIAGLPGRGKTHLAMSLARKALKEGYAVAAVRVVDLLNMFRRAETRGEDAGAELEDALKTVDVLVLDDLGTQRKTDYATEKIYDIIDARYKRLPTVITTSVPRVDMMKHLSDYVASRVYGAETVLIIEGKDWRLEGEWDDIGEEVFHDSD